MKNINATCAIAWGMTPHRLNLFNKPHDSQIATVRAELKQYNLFLKWDSGLRRYHRISSSGWQLYYGSKRGSGQKKWFRGTFEECCREAVKRIYNITPGGNGADI